MFSVDGKLPRGVSPERLRIRHSVRTEWNCARDHLVSTLNKKAGHPAVVRLRAVTP